jgi:hypothetical protein
MKSLHPRMGFHVLSNGFSQVNLTDQYNPSLELIMPNEFLCFSCGGNRMQVFYTVEEVPIHSVLLISDQKEAIGFPTGDIKLAFCSDCGFISNVAFDPSRLSYSSLYEETQGFSTTFHSFHTRLAEQLIERYQLKNKTIVEIGCGKGEFLALLCELGDNRGIGFDPAYIPERLHSTAKEQLTFIIDFYSEKYSHLTGDFYCCKMTLEHIQNPAEFMVTVRRAIGDHKEAVVFFQVPDIVRILDEMAFWDIYYEHCSYFSPGSLARLFRKSGFDIIDLWTDYNNQYLMIEARPGDGHSSEELPQERDLEELTRKIQAYSNRIPGRLNEWKTRLRELKQEGRRVAMWGAGSKGVAFLTTLKLSDEIGCPVDVNPYKKGTYLPVTGLSIASPEQLKDYRPDTVIVMNPIYCNEIRKDLEKLGLNPVLLPITS